MTSDDIKPLFAEISPNEYTMRPWWVVVVNPRRQPATPKFYKAFADKEAAEAAAAEQQKVADEQAKRESAIRESVWEPFRYYAVERPKGGTL